MANIDMDARHFMYSHRSDSIPVCTTGKEKNGEVKKDISQTVESKDHQTSPSTK